MYNILTLYSFYGTLKKIIKKEDFEENVTGYLYIGNIPGVKYTHWYFIARE